MSIRFADKYKEGFEVIIEAGDGHFLLGGVKWKAAQCMTGLPMR